MINRLLIAAASLALACCAHPPFSGSWNAYHSREKEAIEVYNAGSTVGGGAGSLLLFEDGSFEDWGMSCTEAHRGSTGSYTKKGKRVTLTTPKSVETLILFKFRGDTYLATPAEIEMIREAARKNYPIWGFLKKREGELAPAGK